MNNKLHIWTEEILEVVRARWTGKQWTATQIAEDLGPPFTRDAIIGKMSRLGFKGGKTRIPSTRPRNIGRRISRVKKIPETIYQPPLANAFEDLPAKGCHYPAGNGPYTFCGVPVVDFGPYCAYHYALTHYGHRSNTQQQRPATYQRR